LRSTATDSLPVRSGTWFETRSPRDLWGRFVWSITGALAAP